MATDTAPLPVTAPRRLWQLPTFVLGLVAVWAAATYVVPPPDAASRLASQLDDLAAALNRPMIDPAEVEPLIRDIADAQVSTPLTHYLLGSGYLALADQKPTESRDLWTLALQHFDACDSKSLNSDDMAKLAFRRAKAQAATGAGNPVETIAALMNAPAGDDRSESPRLIADCALRLPQPDLIRARDELTKYLGGQNRATPAAADCYKLKLAELHLAMNETEKARRWLKDVSGAALPETLTAAKIALAKIAVAEKDWAAATTEYEAALAGSGLPPSQKGELRFRLAEALLKLGRTPQAMAMYEVAARESGPFGGWAWLKLAELRGADPAMRGQRTAAVDCLERAAERFKGDRDVLTVYQTIIGVCLQESDYASAMRAVIAKSRVSGVAETESEAEVNAAWGTALKKANDPTANRKLQSAAAAYVNLGGLSRLQKALPLYRLAGENAAALTVADMLAEIPMIDPNVLAAVHLERAELLPSTDFEAVKAALTKAMNTTGPAAITARLKLGLLHVNRGQDLMLAVPGSLQPDVARKEAEQIGQFGRGLLRQVSETANVPTEMQTVHEQALFELGRLDLRDAKFTDAEARFKKQLSLYPQGSYSGYGRLWLVCSLLQQARTSDSAKRLLEDALGHLKPLTQSADPYLRTYGEIWTANTMLELGDATAVVPMAKDLMAKYQGKPEELVAGKLLFYAYLKLSTPEPAEASRTLDRMEQAFTALPKTAYPNDPEYSHKKWKTELPKLREELRKQTP